MLSKHLHRGCYNLFRLIHNLWGEEYVGIRESSLGSTRRIMSGFVEFIVACSWDTLLVLLMLNAVYQHGL